MKQKKGETLGLPDNLLPRVVSASGRRRTKKTIDWRGLFTNKVIGLLVLLLLLVVLASYSPRVVQRLTSKNSAGGPAKKVAVAVNDLPIGFPADLPYLNKGKVIHNFAVNQSETNGGIRQWQVMSPLPEVVEAYRNYFKTFGWEIVTDAEQANLAVLGSRKDGLFITVSVQPAKTKDGGSIVEVTVKKAANAVESAK